jgi:CheY-specific phosphatase CheX
VKALKSLSNRPSFSIHSCQEETSGVSGLVGAKGWNPHTHISCSVKKKLTKKLVNNHVKVIDYSLTICSLF